MSERGQALLSVALLGLGLVVLAVVLFAGVFAFRWFYAEPEGQLEAREQILSGSSRINAYNHFFNQCGAVQKAEAGIGALEVQLESASVDDRDRVLSFLTGARVTRENAIVQYNADASKNYTIGQFRDLNLPYQLRSEEIRTECNFGGY